MAELANSAIAEFPLLDNAVSELDAAKDLWARTTIEERISILQEVKDSLLPICEDWAITAARKKLISVGSPLEGEEWLSGPYGLMIGCNALIETLSKMEDKKFLQHLPTRTLASGQIAVKVIPNSIWDRLLLSGINAEVWMQMGVTKDNLSQYAASVYDSDPATRTGKVSLVLGAGNIASIAPLDCFQKLFTENQVVILKMNPVNDYLTIYLEIALKPLIDRNALRIVKGDAKIGAYLCNHSGIEEIHITGAEASHDAIVWGTGKDGVKNKKAGTPINKRRITSELGAVCPTIVVPGPWSSADLKFQAEHIATQKLHNSGFNCIACQMLVLPTGWSGKNTLLNNIEAVMKKCDPRPLYYPGAAERISEFESHGDNILKFDRGSAPACVVVTHHEGADSWFCNSEVFAPAMTTYEISEENPEAYLRKAIQYANEELHGTLGANILIHPATIRKIGKEKFESLITELHYGCIAINAWTGLGFLLAQTPWGAYPGHTLDDVQSGIGIVHNSFMFERPERSVVYAPFRPFPRNLLSGKFSLLPRPPWFVTNKKQHRIGKLLTNFQYKPGWLKLPRIFLNALLG